ncbi:MAG TPA: putative porin, partial [bacterium]|nr:putative porin [bacterium]
MKPGLVGAVVAVLLTVAVSGGAETPTEKRLRQLEDTLRKTQDEVQQLRRQLEQQKAIGQATQKQVEQTAEESKTAAAEAKKGLELPDWTKRTTIFGDVRARLGVRVAFTDELSATIRGASGNPNDPISTNETLNGNFNRKNFNLDWAYLTFTP